MMSESIAPVRLQLKRDEKLTIDWSDGQQSEISIGALRRNCPCAGCRELRQHMSKSRLTVLPTATEGPVTVVKAEPVGNYAIRLTWSDGHDTGIYSYTFLRSLMRGDAR